MMKLRRDVAGFAVGLLCGGVIFGGVGIASGVIATPLTESSQKVTLDGQAVSLEGYNINGSNYFKLRDLGKAMDFGVTWNNDSRTVEIDSNAGSSMFAYWVGVVANLVLTPVAAATSLSVPMAEIATSLNLGIKPILYSFLYGLDQFFLPYELAPALIMFATGYVRVRYLIGIMLTRMVLASLIVAFVATFIWPMMNL